MKLIKKYTVLFSVLALQISCSSDDSPSTNNENDNLIGTWELVELNISPPQDINGDSNTTTNILTELDCVSGTLTFNADNTWNLSFDGVNITTITGDLFNISCSSTTTTGSGTWQLQNNQLTLFQGFTSIFYTLSGNRLTNTIGEDLPNFRSEVYEKQ